MLKPITLVGAGSWGTALALYLARRGQTVRMWSIETSEIDAMIKDRANHRYLPDIPFPDCIHPMTKLADAVKDVDDILMVVPSVGFRTTLTALKPLLLPTARIICATKGLDMETGELLSDVSHAILGDAHPFAALSGPSFAREVAKGLPCAVVAASQNKTLLQAITHRFDSPLFRITQTDDVIGVEVGAIIKNVIAIATGLSDGMQLGVNTKSALITRGLSEIIQLGQCLGGKMETFIGLSGLGDLILTCSDDQSRNRRLGLAIGTDQNIAAAEKEIGQAIEGKQNAALIMQLAQKFQLHLPICEMVWAVLQGNLSAKAAIEKIL